MKPVRHLQGFAHFADGQAERRGLQFLGQVTFSERAEHPTFVPRTRFRQLGGQCFEIGIGRDGSLPDLLGFGAALVPGVSLGQQHDLANRRRGRNAKLIAVRVVIGLDLVVADRDPVADLHADDLARCESLDELHLELVERQAHLR